LVGEKRERESGEARRKKDSKSLNSWEGAGSVGKPLAKVVGRT
jgi:hypothetical protein